MKRLIFFLFVAIFFASCNAYYEDVVDVDVDGWTSDSIAHFEFEIKDTVPTYSIGIQVRNASDYQFQNLWLFMKKVAPDMSFRNDTVQLMLADDYGNWIGSGIGSIYSATYLYEDSVHFSQPGKYIWYIQHGMRTDSLPGIYSVGLKIIENGEK